MRLDRKFSIQFLYLLTLIPPDQFGYTSESNNKERLVKVTDWGVVNLPFSDKDPGHADLIVLLTRCVTSLICDNSRRCHWTAHKDMCGQIAT